MAKGFHYDLSKCIGCRACAVACRFENNTPASLHYRWVAVQERGHYGGRGENALNVTFVSMACNHCEEPACLAACPVDAIHKDGAGATEGVVWIDDDACIGCGYCLAACPYGAPQWNAVTAKVEKCHLCRDRVAEGLDPACVMTCVGEALSLVDLVDPPSNNGDEPDGFASRNFTHPNIRFIR